MNSYSKLISPNITNKLSTCLFGNGSLAATFGMDSALGTVNEVNK